MEKFNIAIDGPAGAGKSTIARLVAKALGFVYVDTGAMYRAVTWKVLQANLPLDKTDRIAALAASLDIRLVPGEQGQLVYVDGEEVTGEIRTTEVTGNVSQVAAIGAVREHLTRLQKAMARQKGVVMDGRDIGSHVLPDAEVKVFLTASVQIRAARRYQELQGTRQDVSLQQLEREIAERDRMDESREVSPLVRASDAVLIDSSSMTIPEVVERILELSQTRVSGGK